MLLNFENLSYLCVLTEDVNRLEFSVAYNSIAVCNLQAYITNAPSSYLPPCDWLTPIESDVPANQDSCCQPTTNYGGMHPTNIQLPFSLFS